MGVLGGSLVVKRPFFRCNAPYPWFQKTKMPEMPIAPPAWKRSLRRFILHQG